MASSEQRTVPCQSRRPEATFSTSAASGRMSPMIRRCSHQRPECRPDKPAPRPAADTSVHGKPPMMRSAHGVFSRSTSLTSVTPRYTVGQCFASTCRQNGSISTYAANRGDRPASSSAASTPRSKRPMPENSDRTLAFLTVSSLALVAASHTACLRARTHVCARRT